MAPGSVHQQSGGFPVARQRQVCTALVVQKTEDIPQLQFLDLVVVLVLWNDKFGYRQCRILWNCRRCSSCGVVDVTVIIQLVFQQSKSYGSRAIQFPRQSLQQGCCRCCLRQLPMFGAWQLRSPTRSLTSLFSRSEVEVPQIDSSTEFNDNLVPTWAFFGVFCAIFRTPREGLSPGVRGFFEPSRVAGSQTPR